MKIICHEFEIMHEILGGIIACHMHGNIVSSRVYVHDNGCSPFLVNVCELGNGTTSKIEIHDSRLHNMKYIYIRVLGGARWGRSPPPPSLRVKDPNFILG